MKPEEGEGDAVGVREGMVGLGIGVRVGGRVGSGVQVDGSSWRGVAKDGFSVGIGVVGLGLDGLPTQAAKLRAIRQDSALRMGILMDDLRTIFRIGNTI
jgi:hypothetical protein